MAHSITPGSPGSIRYGFAIAAAALAFAAFPFAARSQESAGAAADPRFGIERIEFTGNDELDDDDLKDAIESSESPSGFSRFFSTITFGLLGGETEYFDQTAFENDLAVLADLYRGEGFYHAVIIQNAALDSAAMTASLEFSINEGPRSWIDTVIYIGLDSLSAELREQILADPALRKGTPYVERESAVEIGRVLAILQNNGYPFAAPDFERSSASHLASSNNFRLLLAFVPGTRHTFGRISVRSDTDRTDITDELALRHLDFEPGDLYSREERLSSERNLNQLELFEMARVDHAVEGDEAPASIPMEVTVKPQPRNELAPELILSDEDGAFNIGLGATYTVRNFLGDGRIMNLRLQGKTQSLLEIFKGTPLADTSVLGYADLEFRLLQPYFFSRRVSAFWIASVGIEKQKFYSLSIARNRIGTNITLSRPLLTVAEWTLERVRPTTLVDTVYSDEVLASLDAEDQPQFNSILTFTFQFNRANQILSPSSGDIHTLTLEESGILPNVFPNLTGGLPFTQYYKTAILSRWYTDLTERRFNILGLKFRTGYQTKYGESKTKDVEIPLNRRFFSGGSNSVRGWRARALGAMPTELLEFGGDFILEGSAEMRVNHFSGGGEFLGADLKNLWAVYFLDAGNVWREVGDFRMDAVAAAAGLGVRYETLFGPFRLDFGLRVYDPQAVEGRRLITQKKFFSETLAEGVFHFGIGHAF